MGGARAMAAFAIDPQRRDGGAIGTGHGVQRKTDLAAMARLAVAEPWLLTDHARWRPVDTTGERQGGGHGDPPAIAARDGVAEPGGLLQAEVEGKESPRAIGEPRQESLRPASLHVAAADDAVHGEHAIVGAVLPDGEREPAA